MKGKREMCRFDHVVMAVEALRAYMDTCGREENTKKLLGVAHKALHELEAIEKLFRCQNGDKRHIKPLETPLAEFEEKLAWIKDENRKLAAFMEKHGETFQRVQQSYEVLKGVTAEIELVAKTYRVLQRIESKLDDRAQRAKLPVVGESEGAAQRGKGRRKK